MAPSPTTSPSTPRLSDLARHVRPAGGIVTTGWPAVSAKCRDLGITFRPWQVPVGRLVLAKREDGKYAATIGGTGMSIPRQVGKTFLVGAIVFALCLLRPKLTVIWTAHRSRTAEETFGKMQAFAKRRRIAPFVEKIVLGSGDEAVVFTNGSRILFGARERGFGRGFDEVDVLIFDEAQILTENALDDMIPATNQSRQDTGALLLFMGTPPKPKDPGEVFLRMRTEALAGEDPDTSWVEFGADEDYVPPPLPAPLTERDWEQVAKANPSFPEDTPREAILRMRKKLGPDSYLREGLGIYDDTTGTGIFARGAWERAAAPRDETTNELLTPSPPPAGLGIASDVDQVWLSLGAASSGERPHLGSVLRVRRDNKTRGRKFFVDEVKRIQTANGGCSVAIDPKGPAGFLIDDLEAAGVDLTRASLDDSVQAAEDLVEAINHGAAEHGSYTDLDEAVEVVTWRRVGDRRLLARKNGDISSLESVSLALWAVDHAPVGPNVW